MIKTFRAGVSLSALGALIIAAPPVVAALTLALLQSPGQLDWVRGAWTGAYERRFDDVLAIKDLAVSTWGAIEYGLFRQGREGVLVGSDDWLYTTEDFKFYDDQRDQIASKLEFAKSVRDVLATAGAQLIVAVIPDKSRLYPEYLGRYARPDYVGARYETFLSGLGHAGIEAPNLLAAFEQAKSNTQIFLRTDTHWTPAGAAIAAAAIAPLARDRLVPGDQSSFDETSLPSIQYSGDLLKFLPMGVLQSLGPKPDELSQRDVVSTQTGGGLFDDVLVPIVLIGTSYSVDERWNFAGQLELALSAEVANAAREGVGPVVPMREYLASDELVEAPPKVVVWEIPERFLGVNYDIEEDDDATN